MQKSTATHTPATSTEKLPFLKGRLFDLVLSVVSLTVILVVALQVPFTADGYDDRVTPMMFTIFGVIGVASAIMIRHGLLASLKRPEKDPERGNMFYRWFFFWLFPVAVFVVLLPWIIAGVFNSDDMNTIGSMAMLLFIPWLMVGLGFLAAAIVWFPIELTIRSIIKFIRTRGKQGIGGMIVGCYLLLVVAFIAVGSMAASADLPGKAGHPALIAALFGLPGAYEVKSEFFLWIARALGIVMVGLPFVFYRIAKKHADSPIVKEIDTTLS